MKKIIVTGGAGFIGTNLSRKLAEDENNEIYILDNLSRGKESYLKEGVNFDFCDLRSYDETMESFDLIESFPYSKDIDVVYHCACRIGGMQFLHGSKEKEFLALNDNLAIDRNVFKVCMKFKVPKIIYTSSISIYHTGMQNSPNAIFSESDLEKHPLDPEGGYGWSKYIGEKQLQMMPDTSYGIARIFKSYGPYDDFSPESGQVVLSLMRKLLHNEPYHVWGDGTVTRNLVYIDDLVNGLIKMGNSKENQILNFGGNKPISIKELAETTLKISGLKKEITYGNPSQNGPQSRIPNLQKAKKEINWEPTTDLETGLKKCWNWMNEQ